MCKQTVINDRLIISAKNLDFTPGKAEHKLTRPVFLDESEVLMDKLKKLSAKQIAKLMGLSANLASLNHARYQSWDKAYTQGEKKAAILAFSGDVYRGMNAASFDKESLAFAQDHLAILSGLHGVLRPMDEIQPYRLEMGTSLKINAKSKNLYAFWGDKLTNHLDELLVDQKEKVIVNLASSEYFKAIRPGKLKASLINCVFMDWKSGKYQVVMTWAKLARGMMAREIVLGRLDGPNALKKVKFNGYSFNEGMSSDVDYVFTRKQA